MFCINHTVCTGSPPYHFWEWGTLPESTVPDASPGAFLGASQPCCVCSLLHPHLPCHSVSGHEWGNDELLSAVLEAVL